ncbi:FKBP-type peptidyl-prolyl cis-trans isomerase [Peiella sedimenti]|uniref:FKBP-type peptidyl-prolyl cis-trans isomerase n=1 Tax=Peiella sedimenti TaxID=3061083 RepID=UPI003137E74C
MKPAGAWAQDAYLAWSRTRPGWQVTDSGLQYRRVGRAHPKGARPGPTDTVRVHYEGKFIDGRVFDSSYQRNEPAEFPLNRVIRGWTEGLQLMRAGETFEFVIPANLAYGERWVGGDAIPPGSVLVFKVELLSVTAAT